MNIEFGDILIEHLQRHDRSASWLAQRLEKHPSTISKWLSGESRPATPELVVRIADVLGIHEQERRGKLLHSAGFGILQMRVEEACSSLPNVEDEYTERFGNKEGTEENEPNSDAINAKVQMTPQPNLRRWMGTSIGFLGINFLLSALYVSVAALRVILIVLGVMMLVLALVIALVRNFKVELNISINIGGSFSTHFFLIAILLLEIASWAKHARINHWTMRLIERQEVLTSQIVANLYSDNLQSSTENSKQYPVQFLALRLKIDPIQRTWLTGGSALHLFIRRELQRRDAQFSALSLIESFITPGTLTTA